MPRREFPANHKRTQLCAPSALFDAPPPEAHISAIRSTKRDPDRKSIYLDGRFLAALPARIVDELNLTKGAAWTPELARRVRLAVEFDRARRFAMRSLERRQCSRRDLVDKLTNRGSSPEVASQIADEMVDLGAVDDRELAASLVRSQLRRKPAGARLLHRKLRDKGIDHALAEEVIAAALSDVDLAEAALDVARRKLRTLPAGADAATRRRRTYALLVRLGFDPEICAGAVRLALTADAAHGSFDT